MKKNSGTTVLELILPSETPHANRTEREGLTIGVLAGFDDSGAPLVSLPSGVSDVPTKALSTVLLDRECIGKSVALQFETSELHQPVILGLIQGPVEKSQKKVNIELDDERLVLSADREIVLRCGKSSITLTRAGKVLIRGAYLLSRSSGVHRIKGGSVQIN